MAPLDRIQRRFLRQIGLTPLQALEWYKLAPLKCRRGIAILGTLHRVRLGLAPKQLADLFPVADRGSQSSTRLGVRSRTARFKRRVARTDGFNRSMFGATSTYNLFPDSTIAQKDVRSFQRVLQQGVLRAALAGYDNWETLLAPDRVVTSAVQFQRLFECES